MSTALVDDAIPAPPPSLRTSIAGGPPSMRTIVVSFDRVSVADGAGFLGRPRGRLIDVDAQLAAGVHAFVGAPEDGTLALVEVLTGARQPARGVLRVAGRRPHRSPWVRGRIGALTPDAALPEARTVDGAVRLALRARGEAGHRFDAILDPFGLSPLHGRSPSSLLLAERRAVELALALSTPAPRLVVLYEPLADVAITPLEIVRTRTREMAAAGAAVVVATSSPADARALADSIHVLQKGRVLPAVADGGAGAHVTSPELLVHLSASSDPDRVRELVAGLARRPEISGLAWERPLDRGAAPGSAASCLRLRGDDVDACAVALAVVARDSDVLVDAIAVAAPPLVVVPGIALPPVGGQGAPPSPPAPVPFGAPSGPPPLPPYPPLPGAR